MIRPWWEDFFDADYLALWSFAEGRAKDEVEGLWRVLGLSPGSRVLDAPCGYGRLSLELARRGANVVGVDRAKPLLDHAERARGDVGPDRLRYLHHDLGTPLTEGGFDAAVNVFSSIGYETDEDDLAVFRTLAAAVRPGGLVFVETMHRDRFATIVGAREMHPGMRLPDGTLLVEEPRLDAITGRIETVWHWSGPRGSGSKPASIRLYTATELVQLLERAGLRFLTAHRGCSTEPFRPYEDRLGLLALRP